MATVTSANLVIIADNLFALESHPLSKADAERFSAALSPVILALQTDAKASDATAETWISTNRVFIMNSDGVDRVIKLDSIDFTFTAGKIYACELNEFTFFKNRAVMNGFNFTQSDYTTWKGANGIIAFFKS